MPQYDLFVCSLVLLDCFTSSPFAIPRSSAHLACTVSTRRTVFDRCRFPVDRLMLSPLSLVADHCLFVATLYLQIFELVSHPALSNHANGRTSLLLCTIVSLSLSLIYTQTHKHTFCLPRPYSTTLICSLRDSTATCSYLYLLSTTFSLPHLYSVPSLLSHTYSFCLLARHLQGREAAVEAKQRIVDENRALMLEIKEESRRLREQAEAEAAIERERRAELIRFVCGHRQRVNKPSDGMHVVPQERSEKISCM